MQFFIEIDTFWLKHNISLVSCVPSLPGLSMPSSTPLSGLVPPRAPGVTGVNSLGSLSAQSLIKQQAPQPNPAQPPQPIQPQSKTLSPFVKLTAI